MHAVVVDKFHEFSEPLEGRVRHFYADIKGLITIGVGQLVDPVSAALALPMRRPDGTPAGRDEIAAEWARVKQHTCGACPKCPRPECISRLGWRAATGLTLLRLPDEDIDRLVERKLLDNERELRRFLPGWDSWPADAQLALMSWAWAVGPHAHFPRMMAHLRNGSFNFAAEEIEISPRVGTIVERNRRNRALLLNADRIVRHGLVRDVLYWPRELAAELGGDSEAE